MKVADINKSIPQILTERLGLSLTKIKTFEICPYRYYLQYIKKIKIPKNAYNPLFFKKGQAFHKILDNFIKTGIACDFNSETLGNEVEEIKNLCEKIYKSDFVQNLLKFEHASEVPFSIYIENNKLSAKPKYSRKADLSGYIDFYAIDGSTLYVIDWKTGKVANNTEDTFLQVYLYAKALELILNRNFKKFIVGYYYVEHEKELMKELSKKELDQKIEMILNKAFSIPNSNNKNDFPPIIGNHCKYCPFRKKGIEICKFERE